MQKYICPMHPEVASDKAGRCPKCGMELVLEDEAKQMHTSEHEVQSEVKKRLSAYKPLFIIIGLILLTTIVVSIKDLNQNTFSLQKEMATFMAGFFLVFSGFKLLDIKGFAQGYFTYDLLAKRFYPYGLIYPFIELALGISYILFFNAAVVNVLTFVILTFSGIGVLIKLAKHEKFQCSCLGTIFKLPLTNITLIEDFGMAIMALLVLFLH